MGMDTSDAVEAAITGEKANEDPNGVCAEKCPMFVLQRAASEQAIVRTFFGYNQDGSRLRLFALRQGGTLQAWCWFGTTSGLYKWRWMGTTSVSEGLTVRLRDARLTPAASSLVWWETDAQEREGMQGNGTKEELHKQQRLRLRKLSNMQRQLKERVCYQELRFEVDSSVAEGSRDRVVVERLVGGEGQEQGKIACGYDSILQIEATQRRLWVLCEGRLASWVFGATTVQEVTWAADDSASSSGVECVTEAVASGPSSGPDRRESLLTLDRILAGGADASGTATESSATNNSDGGQTGDTVRHVHRKRTTITGAVAIATNAASQDVLLLEPSGRILVCRSTGGIAGQVAVYYLCQLRDERDWSAVRRLISHRHFLVLLWADEFVVCDPKTGLVVCEGRLPEGSKDCSLWESSLDVGIWHGKHIWRLLPCEATEYLERLETLIEALPQDERPVNYLASLSKSLGMVHTSSHYSLRELRRLCAPAEDAEDDGGLAAMPKVTDRRQSTFAATQNISPLVMQKQQDIASELLRHLQNPALVVALLGSIKSHKQFLDTEVETFLDRYNGSQFEDKRLAETWRFLLHTPLNMAIVPLLEEWRKLSHQQASMRIGTGREAPPFDSGDPKLEQLQKGELTWADLSEEEMVALSFEAPAVLLAHLEEEFHLLPRHFQPDTDERIPSSHPLVKPDSEGAFSSKRTEATHIFDTMCSLYFSSNPSRLVPFAELLQRSYPSGPRVGGGLTRSWLFQATLSLPDVSSPSFALSDGQDGERIDAVVQLYGQVGMQGHAMRMLLALCREGGAEEVDYWHRVDGLLAQAGREAALLQEECGSSAKQLEHDEVFHIALTHCLEHDDGEHLRLVLQHRPQRLQPLHLVETLENYLSPQDCPRLEVLKKIGGLDAEDVGKRQQSEVPIVVEKEQHETAFTVEAFREQLAGMFQKS